jgi:cytochrome b6
VFFPWEIGVKADPFSAAPAGIKPEWYFLATYQMLKMTPPKVLGIEGELFGVIIISVLLFVWMLFPFWAGRLTEKRRTTITVIGVTALIGFTVMTVLGWRMP